MAVEKTNDATGKSSDRGDQKTRKNYILLSHTKHIFI
jgi:hypothetical protein